MGGRDGGDCRVCGGRGGEHLPREWRRSMDVWSGLWRGAGRDVDVLEAFVEAAKQV